MQHTCHICGKAFFSEKSKAKFCSRQCAGKNRSKNGNETRECKHCGRVFKCKKSVNKSFCSKSCKYATIADKQTGEIIHAVCQHCQKPFTHPSYKTPKYCSKPCSDHGRKNAIIETACLQCGKPFSYRDGTRKRRFCSRECWYQYGVGENNPCWNSIETKCEQCGKTLYRQPNRDEKVKHHFCSNECSSLWTSANIRGEDHPLWKGGADNNRGPNWLSQRRKALKRDRYTCQHCGATKKQIGRMPAVHHIIPFREFGIERYKDANRLTNLITLCPACHMRAEHNLIPIQPYLLPIP